MYEARFLLPLVLLLLLPLSIVNAKREEGGGPKDPQMIREVLYRVSKFEVSEIFSFSYLLKILFKRLWPMVLFNQGL